VPLGREGRACKEKEAEEKVSSFQRFFPSPLRAAYSTILAMERIAEEGES
jgi:hypothetical protein